MTYNVSSITLNCTVPYHMKFFETDCEVGEVVCKTIGMCEVAAVHCFAGGYNYLHVEKPACPRKPLAELASARDYVSENCFCLLRNESMCVLIMLSVTLLLYIANAISYYRMMLCIAQSMPSQDVCLSVCLSVCPSHASLLSKQLNISLNFFAIG